MRKQFTSNWPRHDLYTQDNDDYFLPAKRDVPTKTNDDVTFVQIALEPPSAKAAASVNLDITNSTDSKIWSCPTRPKLPIYEDYPPADLHQWVIGYQYFGGVTNWLNFVCPNGVSSRSPVKASDAKPGWCLAADVVMRVAGILGRRITNDRVDFSDLPAHHNIGSRSPSGGNELFVDGSVQWIDFSRMYFLTTWRAYNTNRLGFFYQDPSDFDPVLKSNLSTLSALNFR